MAESGSSSGLSGSGGYRIARAGRQPLEPESLSVPEQRGRGGPVHLEHEAGPRAHLILRRLGAGRGEGALGSKATLTDPRLPAPAAWDIASSKRSNG